MTVSRALAAVLLYVVIGSVVGTGVGWAAAIASPHLMRALLPDLADHANVPAAGAALGLIYGTMWGGGIGAWIVGVVAWYESRA